MTPSPSPVADTTTILAARRNRRGLFYFLLALFAGYVLGWVLLGWLKPGGMRLWSGLGVVIFMLALRWRGMGGASPAGAAGRAFLLTLNLALALVQLLT